MVGRGATVEKRIDPADGQAYTRQQFQQEYGGLVQWNTANPAGAGAGRGAGGGRAPAGPEKRKDSDGQFYTKAEFKQVYGGYAEWDAAAGSAQGSGGGGDRRISPANGKAYTKQEFQKHFGGLGEWNAASAAGGRFAPYQTNRPGIHTLQKRRAAAAAGLRVIVGNLRYEVRWQDLKDHFKNCGEVAQADVFMEMDQPGRSKGIGVVEFKTPEAAQKAIAAKNDTELRGRKIWVREDRGERKKN